MKPYLLPSITAPINYPFLLKSKVVGLSPFLLTHLIFLGIKRNNMAVDLSHRHAAVLAGLGSLGKNTLLLTPEFGNRLNLTSVLTNLSLVDNPPFKRDLCIPNCDRCLKSCPADAIRGDGTVIQKKCRKLHSITTPRGFKVFASWECRKVCPVKGNMITKNSR